jgi:hypothetical protein
MEFNPLKEKGMPLEKQLRQWEKLNTKPYSKDEVHPYSRARGILMNGIEVESAIFSHQFFRHCDDLDLKRKLAFTRRIEQQQQKAINWAIPAAESVLEVTIGYEQVAVDLTAWLAKTEPDPYVKQTFDFGLLEDFDHLYRYANLLEMTQGKKAEEIVGEYTEIMPGRPTIAEHRHPFDDVRRHYDRLTADPITQLHALTLVAGEQQTMNFYMNVGNRLEDVVGRGLYLEIGEIEEQHVTQYGSLLDPKASWFEQLVLHEYNECYLYYSFLQEETDPNMKALWELHLSMELEHLRQAGQLLQQYENRTMDEFLPKYLPALVKFQSNIDYVREVLANQLDLTSLETEYMPVSKMPANANYFMYQKAVNHDGVPTQQVIQRHIDAAGEDYRYEIAGPHPIKEYQDRKSAAAQEKLPKRDGKKLEPASKAKKGVEQRQIFDLLKQDHMEVKGLFQHIKDKEAIRRDLFSHLKEAMTVHMELEEKILYPVLKEERGTREQALKAFEEHHLAKRIIQELVKLPLEDKSWMAKLNVLQEVVMHHIEEEEKETFKDARKLLDKETIKGISWEFAHEKQILTGADIGSGAPAE